MDNWKTIAREVVYHQPYADVVIETLARGEERIPYYVLECPYDAVATLALTNDNKLIVLREYRHPIGEIIYNLPGGRAEEGEPLAESAARELREETGYSAERIEPLGRYNPMPGSLRLTIYLFFASQLTQGAQSLDIYEEVEVHLLDIDAVYSQVLSGQHIDVGLQLAVMLARSKGLLST